MMDRTVKCRICGAPYKFMSMTVSDQSACPRCVGEAERRVFEPTPYKQAQQQRRRSRFFSEY